MAMALTSKTGSLKMYTSQVYSGTTRVSKPFNLFSVLLKSGNAVQKKIEYGKQYMICHSTKFRHVINAIFVKHST